MNIYRNSFDYFSQIVCKDLESNCNTLLNIHVLTPVMNIFILWVFTHQISVLVKVHLT